MIHQKGRFWKALPFQKLADRVDSLKAEMEVVDGLLKELGIPLQGVVSDDQRAFLRGVAEVWPGVLHHLCHLHFLKAVQRPIRENDSSLAKELKKGGVASARLSVR